MGIFGRWWQDPEASATLAVALIAGLFALYQLRSVPADRLRRILDGMTDSYNDSRTQRSAVLKSTPPLLKLGYDALASAIEQEASVVDASTPGLLSREEQSNTPRHQNANRLRQELRDWNTSELGVSHFSAEEIVQCEVKFRSLLWAVESIRAAGPDEIVTKEHLSAVKSLVNKMNDLLTDYESGSFPPRKLLGLWHIGLAKISTACTPFVWEKSLPQTGLGEGGSRWGRSVLRIGIAAQHYNDVSEKGHRTTAIVWEPKDCPTSNSPVVVHPRLTREMLGSQMLIPGVPGVPRLLPYFRLWVRQKYWQLIGAISFRPRGRFTAYGGRRLARHARFEGEVETLLRYAVFKGEQATGRYSLNLDWDIAALKSEVRKAKSAGASTAPGGPGLRWLYLKPARPGSSEGQGAK